MVSNEHDQPRLIFYRNTPKNLPTLHPLASSLQHLETSFLLIALERYPHALVSCASSTESALKAWQIGGQQKDHRFEVLLNLANTAIPSHARFIQADLDEFRRKRNDIIHYGFTPKDDEVSAVLLLKTGYRLIAQCYETLFRFPLHRHGDTYGGLRPEFDRQLAIAQRVYSMAVKAGIDKLTYCFTAFAHTIRWGIQHWMMSDWQVQTLESEEEGGWRSWGLKHDFTAKLEREFHEESWRFSCDICGGHESLVCELDVGQLEKGNIHLGRAVCVNCGLVIPANCPFLTDELCVEQRDADRGRILKGFGIAST